VDIVLDTNIIRRNLKLTDQSFDIILDYLSTTKSCVVLPQIVMEETIGLYKELLRKNLQDLENAHKRLSGLSMGTDYGKVPSMNIEAEADAYRMHLLRRLLICPDDIVPYRNDYLPTLVRRAIERAKPFDANGQQFRDGVLWLSILDYAEKLPEKRLILISNNTKEFCGHTPGQLDETLSREAQSRGIEIEYYSDITDFAKRLATSVTFLDLTWISTNISTDTIQSLIEGALDDDSPVSAHSFGLAENETATGHCYLTSMYALNGSTK
jgi:hypothetical protein